MTFRYARALIHLINDVRGCRVKLFAKRKDLLLNVYSDGDGRNQHRCNCYLLNAVLGEEALHQGRQHEPPQDVGVIGHL